MSTKIVCAIHEIQALGQPAVTPGTITEFEVGSITLAELEAVGAVRDATAEEIAIYDTSKPAVVAPAPKAKVKAESTGPTVLNVE